MSVTLEIAGVDRSRRVDWRSLKINNILTNRVDTSSFDILTYGDTTYKPTIGNEVIIKNGATKIFGGVITAIDEMVEDFKIISHKIDCIDYTRLLDHKLVSEVYESMTVNDIIADLLSNWMPAGFTGVNVDCSITIDWISFNFLPISKCIAELAKRVNYDWYVDYDKDIHFFSKEANAAAFDLADDDGSYIFDTLLIRRDNSQVKNVIIVRGGEYLANTLTTEIECSGTDYYFNLPYRFEDFQATLSATALDVGIDFSGQPDDHDVLWNRDEKILKFKSADTPSTGAVLKAIGRPYLPVRVKVYDRESIQSMVSAEGGDGEYEHLIIDETINSKDGARERAQAELYAYARTLSEGEFETEVDGLKAGQQIIIKSTARDIDETFMINKVRIRMRTPEKITYKISLVTTRTFGIIEFLQRLVLSKTKEINTRAREVLDLVEGANEWITIVDAVSTSKTHNPQSEAMTIADVDTVQAIDYAVEFCAGYTTPEDVRRQFILNGSRLG